MARKKLSREQKRAMFAKGFSPRAKDSVYSPHLRSAYSKPFPFRETVPIWSKGKYSINIMRDAGNGGDTPRYFVVVDNGSKSDCPCFHEQSGTCTWDFPEHFPPQVRERATRIAEEVKKLNAAKVLMPPKGTYPPQLDDSISPRLTRADIAKLVDRSDPKVDYHYDSKEVAMGVKEEMEHTDDKGVAEKIAKDHLRENPQYYSLLKLFEKEHKVSMRVGKTGFDMDFLEKFVKRRMSKSGSFAPQVVYKLLDGSEEIAVFTSEGLLRLSSKDMNNPVVEPIVAQGSPGEQIAAEVENRLSNGNVRGYAVLMDAWYRVADAGAKTAKSVDDLKNFPAPSKCPDRKEGIMITTYDLEHNSEAMFIPYNKNRDGGYVFEKPIKPDAGKSVDRFDKV